MGISADELRGVTLVTSMGILPPTKQKDVLLIAMTNALKEILEGRKDTPFWLMILEVLSMANWLVREAKRLMAEACGEGSCLLHGGQKAREGAGGQGQAKHCR